MGVILYIIATILWVILTLLNWVVVCFKYGLSNDYFKQTAIDIDRFGNRNFRAFLNVLMREEIGYQFGNVNETISSVLGKNQRDKTLTRFGRLICAILDSLDKNHCQNSIQNFPLT
jgi:hypothetical protein